MCGLSRGSLLESPYRTRLNCAFLNAEALTAHETHERHENGRDDQQISLARDTIQFRSRYSEGLGFGVWDLGFRASVRLVFLNVFLFQAEFLRRVQHEHL